MKKIIFIAFALCALFFVSCSRPSDNPVSDNSSFEKQAATEVSAPKEEIFTVRIQRAERIIETRGYCSSSRKVLLFENGVRYSFCEESHEDLALLRDNDVIKYTKDIRGNVKIVECIFVSQADSLKKE